MSELTVEKLLRAKEILERNEIRPDEGGWVFWNGVMVGFVSLAAQRRQAAARRKKARQRKCGYRRTR